MYPPPKRYFAFTEVIFVQFIILQGIQGLGNYKNHDNVYFPTQDKDNLVKKITNNTEMIDVSTLEGQEQAATNKVATPNIGPKFRFEQNKEASCNNSYNVTQKQKKILQCKFPFQYQGSYYSNCTKLIKAHRRKKVLQPDEFYCPIKLVKNKMNLWRMARCSKNCFEEHATNSITILLPTLAFLFLTVILFIVLIQKSYCGKSKYSRKETYTTSKYFSKDAFIEKLAQKLVQGDDTELNPENFLTEQIDFIRYKANREIKRSDFTFHKVLGSGNFGSVYKGEAMGLFYPGSITDVAVKTVSDSMNQDSLDTFAAEIKILSFLDLHCNLVNMIGCYTPNLHSTGEVFLLLEFCNEGDLKDFLERKKKWIQKGFEAKPNNSFKSFNSRQLLIFSFDIAKGMEYLASKRVMHGDLAARNVMIASGDNDYKRTYVAKLADFGLSKEIAKNTYYRKVERNFVPWKWMAIEFLEYGVFKLKSDVWSYGVVIWELFSLGEQPYGNLGYEEVTKRLSNGYYLPCPKKINEIQEWPATQIYNEIAKMCFVENEENRSSFSDIVNYLCTKLTDVEKRTYEELRDVYHTRNNLYVDNPTK
jgi:serine/threonine protein kinase